MRLLDLFCGAGGCSVGYSRAGFTEIVGVDNRPMPRYPFEFIQGDALEYLVAHGSEFDAIHASPPCQAFSTMRVMPNARQHSDLLTPARKLLEECGLPWVIENVVGAPMKDEAADLFDPICGITLCGSMFALHNGENELRRHRIFESSINLRQPRCLHTFPVIGFYGDHARTRQRTVGRHRDRGGDITGNERKLKLVRELMGIDWMTWDEAKLSIPPAYCEFIGRQLIQHLTCSATLADAL